MRRRTTMGSLKNLGQGFLVATALIWIFNIASLFINGDAWIALLYLLILLIPLTSLTYLKLKNPKTQASYEDPSLHLCLSVYPSKWRKLLFSFQGVALAFWMFDLATTFYAINVTGLAVELNPLGWPLGILGALSYYAPTLVFSYILLFKIKDKISLYAAIPLTLMTLAMSAMNLMAGAQNFQVFVDTATLTTGVRSGLMAVIGTVSLTMPFALKRKVNQPKAVLP